VCSFGCLILNVVEFMRVKLAIKVRPHAANRRKSTTHTRLRAEYDGNRSMICILSCDAFVDLFEHPIHHAKRKKDPEEARTTKFMEIGPKLESHDAERSLPNRYIPFPTASR
jgi:hypothetical protein